MADHRYFIPYVYTPSMDDKPRSIGQLMGISVPVNVEHVDLWNNKSTIAWRTRNGSTHEMDFDGTDAITVIVAMRLSC